MKAEVWVLPASHRILVTEYPGPPMEICSPVSEEARKAIIARGWPTVSDIGFPKELFLGSFELPEGGGWGEAGKVAQEKAAELGYVVDFDGSLSFCGDSDADDWDAYDPCAPDNYDLWAEDGD
jgi:hypothetical protein